MEGVTRLSPSTVGMGNPALPYSGRGRGERREGEGEKKKVKMVEEETEKVRHCSLLMVGMMKAVQTKLAAVCNT